MLSLCDVVYRSDCVGVQSIGTVCSTQSVDAFRRGTNRYLVGVLDLVMLALAVLAIALVTPTMKQYSRSLLRTVDLDGSS
jgi:hypothetical protein